MFSYRVQCGCIVRVLFPQPALIVFGELLFFLAVLFLGLVYIWGKGDLGWIRTFRAPPEPGLRSWRQASVETTDEQR